MIRGALLLRYALEDIRHECPAADSTGGADTFRRRTPHIYTPDQIIRLLGAAAALLPAGSIRPLTYTTLFGLLAATEACGYPRPWRYASTTITADGLVIRQTRVPEEADCCPCTTQHPGRAEPVRISMRVQLRATAANTLFVSATGNVLSYNTVQANLLAPGAIRWAAR